MEVKDYLPFAVVGGGALLAYLLLKPQPYTVVNPPTPQGPSEDARLNAVVALTQLAVERERARWEYAATVEAAKAQAEYELRARQIEAEQEARRIQAEKEVQQKAADAQFWGTFWSGLFGIIGSGLALFAGLSDEALYNRLPYPPYIGHGGQLAALSRRR
ncbi:peptidase [Thermus phage phiKo]|nr:peptidase [Thermus phage phiKo]